MILLLTRLVKIGGMLELHCKTQLRVHINVSSTFR